MHFAHRLCLAELPLLTRHLLQHQTALVLQLAPCLQGCCCCCCDHLQQRPGRPVLLLLPWQPLDAPG